MLLSLIILETRTLIGVLIWGNLALGSIVFMYHRFIGNMSFSIAFKSLSIIRFMAFFGYLLMFFRGGLPDIMSVNVCNTLLFFSHYLEARLIFDLIGGNNKRAAKALTGVFIIGALAFNILEFIYRDPALRIGMASIVIFSTFLLPAVNLIASDDVSKFKKGISVFYVLLLSALIPRAVESFVYRNVHIMTNDYFQTLMFLSLILMMISNTIIYLLFIKEETDKLIEKMAAEDDLTGLLNRRSFLSEGKRVFESHKAARTELVLLFFDIDCFKKINDEHGHKAGDEVLTRFSDIVKNNVRPTDLCCRYGGDEFVVFLQRVNENMGKTIVSRIMNEIEKHTFSAEIEFKITISAGSVACIPKAGELLEDYIHKADEALYEAKRTGRSKLVSYAEINNPAQSP